MIWLLVPLGALLLVAIYDLTQKKHAILRNFPVIGHFRYWLEAIGPELRQYIVSANDEELPFSRDRRRWVYASAKKENNYSGFGTNNALEASPNYVILKHRTMGSPDDAPHDELWSLPVAKILGGHRERKHAFRPESVVCISGMSFGSLSGPAVVALNRGSAIAGCLHNTGEGGLTEYLGQARRLLADLADAPPHPLGLPTTTSDFEHLRWFPYPDEA